MNKTPEILKCPDCGATMRRVSHSRHVTYECKTESCIVIDAHFDKKGNLVVYRMPLTTNYQGVGDV